MGGTGRGLLSTEGGVSTDVSATGSSTSVEALLGFLGRRGLGDCLAGGAGSSCLVGVGIRSSRSPSAATAAVVGTSGFGFFGG